MLIASLSGPGSVTTAVRSRRGLVPDSHPASNARRPRTQCMAEPNNSAELFQLPMIRMAEKEMKEYCKAHPGVSDDEKCSKAMKWLDTHLEAAKDAATGSKDGGSATGSYDALYKLQVSCRLRHAMPHLQASAVPPPSPTSPCIRLGHTRGAIRLRRTANDRDAGDPAEGCQRRRGCRPLR